MLYLDTQINSFENWCGAKIRGTSKLVWHTQTNTHTLPPLLHPLSLPRTPSIELSPVLLIWLNEWLPKISHAIYADAPQRRKCETAKRYLANVTNERDKWKSLCNKCESNKTNSIKELFLEMSRNVEPSSRLNEDNEDWMDPELLGRQCRQAKWLPSNWSWASDKSHPLLWPCFPLICHRLFSILSVSQQFNQNQITDFVIKSHWEDVWWHDDLIPMWYNVLLPFLQSTLLFHSTLYA